jgi:hypothetical protein
MSYIEPVVEVIATDEWLAWYNSLDSQAAAAVRGSVDALEIVGLALGHPRSSEIKGADFALRELRQQAGGRPLRTLYAFDPRRNAVLLIGGDKTGDARFYERMIPIAERIWRQYLKEQGL